MLRAAYSSKPQQLTGHVQELCELVQPIIALENAKAITLHLPQQSAP